MANLTSTGETAPVPGLDLEDCLTFAKELARQAGTLQAAAHARIPETAGGQAGGEAKSFSVVSKGGIDLVTDIDKQCEKLIFESLRKQYPSHLFIGEESASTPELTDEITWCVDPVDGTTNFVHNFPCYCVSIGMFFRKRAVLGVIYDPTMSELYEATQGGGAFVTGPDGTRRQLHVDSAATLQSALVSTNFGHSRDPTIIKQAVDSVQNLLNASVRSIRMSGSCCMNMAMVAKGVLSCYWERDIGGLWDICAGTIIVREAGGVVMVPDADNQHNEPCRAGKQKLICGNAAIVSVVGACIRDSQ